MVVTRLGMKEAQVGTCAIKQIEVWSPLMNLFFFRKYTLHPANLQILWFLLDSAQVSGGNMRLI